MGQGRRKVVHHQPSSAADHSGGYPHIVKKYVGKKKKREKIKREKGDKGRRKRFQKNKRKKRYRMHAREADVVVRHANRRAVPEKGIVSVRVARNGKSARTRIGPVVGPRRRVGPHPHMVSPHVAVAHVIHRAHHLA